MNQPAARPDPTTPDGALPDRRRWVMLAVATLGFAVNFWAWALLSPLGPRFKDGLGMPSLTSARPPRGTGDSGGLEGRANLLNWDGKGAPTGMFPSTATPTKEPTP